MQAKNCLDPPKTSAAAAAAGFCNPSTLSWAGFCVGHALPLQTNADQFCQGHTTTVRYNAINLRLGPDNSHIISSLIILFIISRWRATAAPCGPATAAHVTPLNRRIQPTLCTDFTSLCLMPAVTETSYV